MKGPEVSMSGHERQRRTSRVHEEAAVGLDLGRTPRGPGATGGGSGILHEVGTFVEYAQPPASGSLPSGTAGGARGSACGPRPVPLCRHLPV